MKTKNFPLHFWRFPADESERVQRKMHDTQRGAHLFFRRVKTMVQARYAELVDHSDIPQVFLQGSTHIDNYAKTLDGAAMIDFDRAYHGPFTWDILALMLSLSLRQLNGYDTFVEDSVLEAFETAYLKHFQQTELPYEQYPDLLACEPKAWESSTEAYLQAEKKWAKKINKLPLDINDPLLTELVAQYFSHNAEINAATDYSISKAGRAYGTFGRQRFLIVLTPKEKTKPYLFLDAKEALNYKNKLLAHDPWYIDNFDHRGKRMIAAAKLYAPNLAYGESYASINGVQYWIRLIPSQNRKIKKNLSLDAQQSFAYCVGSQLGRGHGLSLQNVTPQQFLQQFPQHFSQVIQAAKIIQQELLIAWRYYLQLSQAVDHDAQ